MSAAVGLIVCLLALSAWCLWMASRVEDYEQQMEAMRGAMADVERAFSEVLLPTIIRTLEEISRWRGSWNR